MFKGAASKFQNEMVQLTILHSFTFSLTNEYYIRVFCDSFTIKLDEINSLQPTIYSLTDDFLFSERRPSDHVRKAILGATSLWCNLPCNSWFFSRVLIVAKRGYQSKISPSRQFQESLFGVHIHLTAIHTIRKTHFKS